MTTPKNNIGKIATLEIGKLKFKVKIADERFNFGRWDYLVTPVAGEGEKWVLSESVKIEK